METTYFTVAVREASLSEAAGGDRRRAVYVRSAPGKGTGKVIDLAGWRACHPAPAIPPDGEDERDPPPVRPRRSLGEVLLWGAELLATLAVAGVLAALVLRLLGL